MGAQIDKFYGFVNAVVAIMAQDNLIVTFFSTYVTI